MVAVVSLLNEIAFSVILFPSELEDTPITNR